MNNNAKIYTFIAAGLIILALTIVNILNSKDLKKCYDNKIINICIDNKIVNKIKFSDIEGLESTTFNANYQRKVGTVELKEYTGIEIIDILKASDISIDKINYIEVLSVDNYLIKLSMDEVLMDNNVYIVFREKDKYLDDKFGPYMLVIKQDKLVTRWAKYIVNINIMEDN